MPGTKFKINPETLKYEPTRRPFWKISLYIISFLAGCAIFIILAYVLVIQYFYSTPREKTLQRENSQLQLQLKNMNNQLEDVSKDLNYLKENDNKIYRAIFGSQPIPEEIWKAGFGGSDRYNKLEKLKDAEILVETNKKLEKLQNQIDIQKNSYKQVINLAIEKEKKLRSIPAIQPIANKDLKRFASGWGTRIHPIYKIPKFHFGIDFTANEGTEIYTTGDGLVEEARTSKTYGKVITINHGYGIKTLYAHLSAFNIKKGQKVKRGDIIGYVGNTGLSAGDHLHYEVMVNGKKVNPINYFFNDLTPKEYDMMIKMSAVAKKSLD